VKLSSPLSKELSGPLSGTVNPLGKFLGRGSSPSIGSSSATGGVFTELNIGGLYYLFLSNPKTVTEILLPELQEALDGPWDFSGLKQLQVFNATGSVINTPPLFDGCVYLQALYFAFSTLIGTPNWNIPSLVVLDVSNTYITGLELTQFPQLQVLIAAACVELTSTAMDSIYNQIAATTQADGGFIDTSYGAPVTAASDAARIALSLRSWAFNYEE
jgi:hypothetical protein